MRRGSVSQSSLIRWIGRALVFAGISLLTYSAWFWLRGAVFQAREIRRLESNIPQPAPQGVLGELSIPRIGLTTVILDDDDSHALSLGAGHIPGTALPGDPGNVGLAGHRDTVFRRLRNISRQDRIVLTTPRGSFEYQVERVRVTVPEDVAVLDPGAQPSVTLVTCYPFSYLGAAPRRFVVTARQVRATAALHPSSHRVHWNESASWVMNPLASTFRHGWAPSWPSFWALAASWPF